MAITSSPSLDSRYQSSRWLWFRDPGEASLSATSPLASPPPFFETKPRTTRFYPGPFLSQRADKLSEDEVYRAAGEGRPSVLADLLFVNHAQQCVIMLLDSLSAPPQHPPIRASQLEKWGLALQLSVCNYSLMLVYISSNKLSTAHSGVKALTKSNEKVPRFPFRCSCILVCCFRLLLDSTLVVHVCR